MRLLVSFFLSSFIYFCILFFFYKLFFNSETTSKEVLVHTAINTSLITSSSEKKEVKRSIKKQIKKEVSKKTPPKKKVKQGSKTSITKGGNVNFKDIFKNVRADVDTTPVKFAKFEEKSRFKGIEKIQKNLSKIKNINGDIQFQNNSSSKISDAEVDKIVNKIGKIWYEISDIPGEYAKINVISSGGRVKVIILDSNLDERKQKELISLIENMNFNKNFNLNILFQTKVNR